MTSKLATEAPTPESTRQHQGPKCIFLLQLTAAVCRDVGGLEVVLLV